MLFRSKVGRYKFNKKLNLAYRLPGCKLAEDVFNPETGEVMAHAGEIVEEAKAIEMQDAGVNEVFVLVSDPAEGEIKHKIIANNTVNFKALSQKNPKIFGLLPTVYYPNFRFMQKIAAECESAKPEDVAEKYRDEINSIYYTVEIPEAEDEKPEDKKNREIGRESCRERV